MRLLIRDERASDQVIIEALIVDAFVDATHASATEHLIVAELRDQGALVASLVAEQDGQVLGHVALSPVNLSSGALNWYGLGPIAVRPENQRQGIGSRLMLAAKARLEDLGAAGCVLLGEPAFYHRFGFAAVPELVLADVPPKYFQVLLLQGDLPEAQVSYHPAFSITSE